ncbi:MAG TPA: peptidylprolyl isomerase [Anaerolineaceae bacterium]|nr:peptidylprolyl isomerase [Anaerolineaceae bacterium]
MNNSPELDKVRKDLVVSMDYELTVDGEMIDSSEENDPLEFIQGHEHIIPGLESAIEGMTVGESKEVFVKAEDAYGPFDPENFVEIPKSEFPEEIPLEVGIEIGIEDENGEEQSAFIEEVTLDSVTLNFNHPLAGKDLNFKVKIVGIREATADELEHDHIHGHEHEDDEDCCCGNCK